MKNAVLLSLLLAVSATAAAGFSEHGVADVRTGSVSRVADLKNMPDDSRVVLEGRIEKQVRREHYIFRDASGSIEVEIDDDVWRGVNVTPRDRVRLTAEVDQDWNGTEVDVKSVVKIQ
ncbi:MAG: NirD/YgiW/YdeI family stress tolerance protein [Eikenella sp.]|nr:NirD/YgiW/YdeI family stress tolerance protein [Eikenella sp.]